jgi:hypothetical protein
MIGSALLTSNSSKWNTPPHIVERVVLTLGRIDLDPCADEALSIPAARHYTIHDDGLAQPWSGRTYMNPPYGRQIARWVEKLDAAFQAGSVTQAVALLPNRTDTRWYRRISYVPKVELHGRLHFSNSKHAAPFPSVIFAFGVDQRRLLQHFGDIGTFWLPVNAEPVPVFDPRLTGAAESGCCGASA